MQLRQAEESLKALLRDSDIKEIVNDTIQQRLNHLPGQVNLYQVPVVFDSVSIVNVVTSPKVISGRHPDHCWVRREVTESHVPNQYLFQTRFRKDRSLFRYVIFWLL